jgi:hypothetical protein
MERIEIVMVRLRALAGLTTGLFLAALVLPLAQPSAAFAEGRQTDGLIPADAGFIVSINVRQLLDNPLVKKDSRNALEAALAKNEHLAKLLKETGLDPLKDVDTITMTGTVDVMNPRGFGVVRGHFQPDKILAVAAEHAKEHPDKLKVVKDGGREMVQIQTDNKPLYAAFADSKTLIVSPEKAYTAELIEKAGKAPERLNKTMQGALSKLSGKEIISLAVVIPDKLKEAIKEQNKDAAELLSSVECITGGIELSDGLKIAAVVHTADEAGATMIKKKIEEFLPLLNLLASQDEGAKAFKEALETLKVTNDKNSVTVSMHVTEDVIKKAAPKLPKAPRDK